MRGISQIFMVAAVLSALAGMAWGIQMAASHDHTLSPAHGHLNLLGWVSCAIYAFYYHLAPEAAEGLLPRLHLAAAVLALAVLVPGIALAIQGVTEAVAQAGSLLSVLSMLLFAAVVLRPRAARRAAAQAG